MTRTLSLNGWKCVKLSIKYIVFKELATIEAASFFLIILGSQIA
jgi:hypothetical protein